MPLIDVGILRSQRNRGGKVSSLEREMGAFLAMRDWLSFGTSDWTSDYMDVC